MPNSSIATTGPVALPEKRAAVLGEELLPVSGAVVGQERFEAELRARGPRRPNGRR